MASGHLRTCSLLLSGGGWMNGKGSVVAPKDVRSWDCELKKPLFFINFPASGILL
jgi:hypothetical protein